MRADPVPGSGGSRSVRPAGFARGTALAPYEAAAVTVPTEESVDPRRLLMILWRRRWIFVSCLATAILIGAVITLTATPKFKAVATLEINQPEAQISTGPEREESIAMSDPQFLATQLGLLKSETLADRVAREPGINADPGFVDPALGPNDRIEVASTQIQGELDVEPVETSRLIRLSYVDTDPARAARIANAVLDNFVSMNLERKFDATSSARNFLQNRIGTVKAALERSERQLVQYAAEQGITLVDRGASPDEGGSGGVATLDSASLVDINAALSTATNARIEAEQRYRHAAGMANRSEVVNNSTVQGLIGDRARLQAEYQQNRNLMKPDHPQMVSLQARIDALSQQIATQVGSQTSSLTGTLAADYHAALGREGQLRSRVSQLKASLQDLRARSVQYNILSREVDTNRTLYDGLLQRYKEIGVAGGISASAATILDRAKTPRAPYSPSLVLNLLIAIIAGLIVGIALAFGVEYWDDTIKTPDEIKTKLKENSLGAIPVLAKDEVFFDSLRSSETRIAEAYSTVRAAIQFSTADGAPKSMLVTSSRSEEGKSSSAFAIAYTLARLGSSALIIDADMRKPSFYISGEEEGLSSILTGRSTFRGSLRSTDVEGLFLLSSGPPPPNPAELLSSERMTQIISESEGHFDYVIVDAPPLLGLADAALLGSLCRGTIFIVEAGKTRRPAAASALERLRLSGAHVLGVVLTKYRGAALGYEYDRYYLYGEGGNKKPLIPLVTSRFEPE